MKKIMQQLVFAPCRLTKLVISQSGVGDLGLAAMGSLTGLRELDLSNNWAMTDDGMAALSGLRDLQWLNLTGSNQVRLSWWRHMGVCIANTRAHPSIFQAPVSLADRTATLACSAQRYSCCLGSAFLMATMAWHVTTEDDATHCRSYPV